MISKHLLRPQRLRHIPASFSWVDHRLVRHDYLPRADHSAWALYLFLVTVADAQGLSYYSDPAIGRHLKMDTLALSAARQQLVQIGNQGYMLSADGYLMPTRKGQTPPDLKYFKSTQK